MNKHFKSLKNAVKGSGNLPAKVVHEIFEMVRFGFIIFIKLVQLLQGHPYSR